MKNKMITAVLAMSMVLGAGSAAYAADKTVSCTNTAGPGQNCDSCKALRCADGAGLRDALQEKTGS